jgi:hypothetical protein
VRSSRRDQCALPIGVTASLALHAAMIGVLAVSGGDRLSPFVRWGLLLLLAIDGVTVATALRRPVGNTTEGVPSPLGLRLRRALGLGPGSRPPGSDGRGTGPAGHPSAAAGGQSPAGADRDGRTGIGPVVPRRPAPPLPPFGRGVRSETLGATPGAPGPAPERLVPTYGPDGRPDRRAHRRDPHAVLLDDGGIADAIRRARSGRQPPPHALVVADLGAPDGWDRDFGPGAAERLHLAVAGVIRSAVRSTATSVGRGADGRFLVHLSGLNKGLPATEAIVRRVADALATPVLVQDTLLSIAARLGVGLCTCGRCDYERMRTLAALPPGGGVRRAHPAGGPSIVACRSAADGGADASTHPDRPAADRGPDGGRADGDGRDDDRRDGPRR